MSHFVEAEKSRYELLLEYSKYLLKNSKSFENFLDDEYRYEEVKFGNEIKIGKYTNPNKKWDWWEIGGRWPNIFLLKNNALTNSAKKSDIDFDKMIQIAKRNMEDNYDLFEKISQGKIFELWETVKSRYDSEDFHLAKEKYLEQPVAKKLREEFLKSHGPFFDIDKFLDGKEKYINDESKNSICFFAVVNENGWFSKGEMGYFGISYNEKEDNEWQKEFFDLLNSVTNDYYLTVVDCHI